MNRTVEKNKTLLVDGPASVTLVTGKAEAFGATITTAGKVVIREGKRLPFLVLETATFDISHGENALIEEVEGDTVPQSWIKSFEEIASLSAKPIVVLVLGAVDSGKTSLCTYLTNRALTKKWKVAVLDGDLGQADIGPPSTIAYAFVTKSVTDLFSLRTRNAFFVGDTSPIRVKDKVIEGLCLLKKELLTANPDIVVVNTDGWTDGECAVDYKVSLAKAVDPDLVLCLQQKDELASMCNALADFKKTLVESPLAVFQRNIEKRRSLRELGYVKYLRNAKVQSLSLGWVKVEGNELFDLCKARLSMKQANKIYSLLGMKPLHVAEFNDRICVVIGRRRWIEGDNIKKVEEFTKKKVVVTRKGEEEGLFAGLFSAGKKFLGVGVLQEIDYLRKSMKVYTPVSDEISTLVLGNVRLDKNMKEISTGAEEDSVDFSSFNRLF